MADSINDYGVNKDYNKLTWQTRQFSRKPFDSVLSALAQPSPSAVAAEKFKRDRSAESIETLQAGQTVRAPGGFQIHTQEPNEAPPKYDSVRELEYEMSRNRDAFRDRNDQVSNPVDMVEGSG